MATSPLDYIPNVNTGVNAGGLPPALLKKTAASLSSALSGELPLDVQNLLRQQAAEYGVASGMPGSQFQSYAGLRNLGLTSLDRIKGAENILGNQFINPAESQRLNLQAGTARAGLAQNQAELAQQKELEQQRLAQQQGQFTAGQSQQAQLAALQQSGENYRASLGLGGRGGSGSSGGGFTGGAAGSGFTIPEASYASTGGGYGTGPVGGTTYDYGFDYSGSPYSSNTYDDGYGGGFTNYDDVIDYYGY